MYQNLITEAQYIQNSWGYNFLDAIQYIADYKEEYPAEIRRELQQFLADGARMFATKENV